MSNVSQKGAPRIYVPGKDAPSETTLILLKGFESFKSKYGTESLMSQKKKQVDLILIGCSDARTRIENISKSETGKGIFTDKGINVHYMALAGNVVTPGLLRELKSVLVENPNAEIAVLGHTLCGGVHFALETARNGTTPEGAFGRLYQHIHNEGIQTFAESGNSRDAEILNTLSQCEKISRETGKHAVPLLFDLSTLKVEAINGALMTDHKSLSVKFLSEDESASLPKPIRLFLEGNKNYRNGVNIISTAESLAQQSISGVMFVDSSLSAQVASIETLFNFGHNQFFCVTFTMDGKLGKVQKASGDYTDHVRWNGEKSVYIISTNQEAIDRKAYDLVLRDMLPAGSITTRMHVSGSSVHLI